jgi:hypothetical protein
MFAYPEQSCVIKWEDRQFSDDTLYDPDSHIVEVFDPTNTKRVTYDVAKLANTSVGCYKYTFNTPADVIYGDWYVKVKAIKGNSTTVMNLHFEMKKL